MATEKMSELSAIFNLKRSLLFFFRQRSHTSNFLTSSSFRSPEALESDAEIAQFLTDCAEELAAADNDSGSPCEVTDLEKELMEALRELSPGTRPEEDEAWTEALSAQLGTAGADGRSALKDAQKRLRDELAALTRVDAELRASMTRHGRLLTSHDIRTVLKALGRFDDPQVSFLRAKSLHRGIKIAF